METISGINRIEVLDELKLLLADDEILYNCPDKKPVSYTHLDVYKRQIYM